MEKIPITLQLNIFALIVTIPTGIILGIIGCIEKNKMSDHAISTADYFLIPVCLNIIKPFNEEYADAGKEMKDFS